MTITELIEYLKTLDPEAIIYLGSYYYEDLDSFDKISRENFMNCIAVKDKICLLDTNQGVDPLYDFTKVST